MIDEFKVLILPGDLNKTPRGEDLILLITKEEFLRMWKRGQVILRNKGLKEGEDGKFIAKGSIGLS